MTDIVIFGAGHSAALAKVYIERYSAHRIVGFTVDTQYATSETFCDLPLVAWPRLEEAFPPAQIELLGPISFSRMNQLRRDRYYEGKRRNYRYFSFMHPDSHVYTEEIGEHCFILDNNVIEPFVKIGNNVIIWGSSHIGHNSIIEDDCFLSAQVFLGARTRIGTRSVLAARAAVRGDVTIGEACLIGFGVVVQKDVAAGSVVANRAPNRVARFLSSRMPEFR